jgi:hypothetical protein
MRKRILTLATTLSVISSTTFACDINGNSGFAPANNLRIAVGDKASNNMTEARFNEIINKVEKFYAPVIKTKGGTLKIERKWTDETVNAYAQRSGNTWMVSMFGGLARHQLVTDDGFMLVLCHELGHHLGGAPKKGSFSSTWASNEGQSDYFGSMKCARRVLESEDNISIVSQMNVDQEAKTKCGLVYTNENEFALCQRIAMAGKSLAMLLGDLGGSSNVAFTTPDQAKVTRTNDNHPAAQCRLDTYFQGILCDKSYQQDVDNKNPVTGVCIKKDGYQVGMRPLCWYKPGTEE